MYQTYLFDMDGTVLDTAGDLCDAVNHTLRSYGYPPRTQQQIIDATGNGAARSGISGNADAFWFR